MVDVILGVVWKKIFPAWSNPRKLRLKNFPMKKAILYLEDGTTFYGESVTIAGETAGEVVFNTAMTGYQEILTDPSYAGQIVTMTYPLIGNYGVNEEDVESNGVHVKGFIAKEFCRTHSNYRATQGLIDYLKEYNVLAMEGIDTRALTRHLRLFGAMKGMISTEDFDLASLSVKLKKVPSMEGMDWVRAVTTRKPYVWKAVQGPRFKVAAWIAGSSLTFCVFYLDLGVRFTSFRLILQKKISRPSIRMAFFFPTVRGIPRP